MSRKRDTNWSRDEINILLDTIMEITKLMATNGRKTNSKEVFEYAAKKMGEKGHHSRAEREKCRTKWKKMKEEFNHAKRAREGDTRFKEAPGIQPFYDRMEEFINGNYDNISPHSTIVRRTSSLSSSSRFGSAQQQQQQQPPPISPEKRASARIAATHASTTNGTSPNDNNHDTSSSSSTTTIVTKANTTTGNEYPSSMHTTTTTNLTTTSNNNPSTTPTPSRLNPRLSSGSANNSNQTTTTTATNSSSSSSSGASSSSTVNHDNDNINNNAITASNAAAATTTTTNSANNHKPQGRTSSLANNGELCIYTAYNNEYPNSNSASTTGSNHVHSGSNDLISASPPEHADISYRVSSGCRQITIFGDHDVDIKFRRDRVTINKIDVDFQQTEA